MATNQIDILDQALLYPRCIDQRIEFLNPMKEVYKDSSPNVHSIIYKNIYWDPKEILSRFQRF